MPNLSEIYPTCLLFIALLGAATIISKGRPSDRVIVIGRDLQVDGLRALLAFGVMAYHFLGIHHRIFGDGSTLDISSVTVKLMRNWTVQIFFAITAYLFGQRMTDITAQTSRSSLKFLSGRFFRLAPLTIVFCCIFLLAEYQAYFYESNIKMQLRNWLVLINAALSSIFFPAGGPITTNAESTGWDIAGTPQWTLHFEWIFYLCITAIPILSFKKKNIVVPVIVTLLLLTAVRDSNTFFVQWDNMTWAFIPGLIVGFLKAKWVKFFKLSHSVIGAIAIGFVIYSTYADVLILKLLANTLFLVVVLSDNQLTRWLKSTVLRSLGETTYSVYLLHGLVQYATLKWIVTIPIARSMPEWLWWMTCALQVVVIVIIARLSFEYVEKPGIVAGKRFYTWLINLIERRAKWLLDWI